MIGYLHREKTADGEAGFVGVQDVKVDFPWGEVDDGKTDFSPNVKIQVKILEGNDGRDQEAFVVHRYPLFGSSYNSDRLGAEIVLPEIDPAGVFLQVGTKLTIRLIRSD